MPKGKYLCLSSTYENVTRVKFFTFLTSVLVAPSEEDLSIAISQEGGLFPEPICIRW
jgi:hypothetical protein